MPTKICTKCGIEKDVSEFCKDRTSKDGLNGWCKACDKIRRESPEGKISKFCEICGDEYSDFPCNIDNRHTCRKPECTKKWKSQNRIGKKTYNWVEKIKRICPICGDEYQIYPREIDARPTCRKQECKSKWQSQTRSGKNHPRWKGRITNICEICGDEYPVIPSQADKHHTCEKKECRSKWKSQVMRGKNSMGIKKNCEICGDEYPVKPSQVDKRHTCRKPECTKKWQSQIRSGQKHPNWQGGKIKKICEICGDEYSDFPCHIDGRHICKKPECNSILHSMMYQGITNIEDWEGYITIKKYCELWNPDLLRRIRLFLGNRSLLSRKTIRENGGRRLPCHHVYYQKKACCEWNEDDQGYYATIDGERYYIGDDPNKFVILTSGEHGMVNKDKLKYAKLFEDIIRDRFGGKSYYSKKEYQWIMQEPGMNEFSQINGTYISHNFGEEEFSPNDDKKQRKEIIKNIVEQDKIDAVVFMESINNMKSPYQQMLALAS